MSQIAASSAILIGLCSGSSVYSRTEANAARALRRSGQCHQRIREVRELPDEMNLAEPRGIKAERIGEIDLCEDVLVALSLGETVRAGRLLILDEHSYTRSAIQLASRMRR